MPFISDSVYLFSVSHHFQLAYLRLFIHKRELIGYYYAHWNSKTE